ncbi:MAG: hypothetical protein ABSC87_08135 [Halobacteriota archaeon]|jgi:hypothetical protein
MYDSDDRMLARYRHIYKKALKVKAFQLQKIQRAETREVCISVLLRTVAICDNVLKEMGFEQYEAGPEHNAAKRIKSRNLP